MGVKNLVQELVQKYNCLSQTFAESMVYKIEKEKLSEEEIRKLISEENIRVLEDIVPNSIIHCWCDEKGRHDVLIYVSNKYMWIIYVTDKEAEITKIPVEFMTYIPRPEKAVHFRFSSESKEFRYLDMYLKDLHTESKFADEEEDFYDE